ncbi:MAG: phosphoribosylformylglycinamidine synthase [Deltaproteobacteria bacterium]
MVFYFGSADKLIYYVVAKKNLTENDLQKLSWLFGNCLQVHSDIITGTFIGPRKEMITPWSTNAAEICVNMGISGIDRIEVFENKACSVSFDPMIQQVFYDLNSETLKIDKTPEEILPVDNIEEFNLLQGLALSGDEIGYLNELSKKLARKLTDSEIFGFSQINSEHCRHKIFNGVFIIDNKEMPYSLFQLIRKTSSANKNRIVSAYSDNVAFIDGPRIKQFAPTDPANPGKYDIREIKSIISLKAETHNFPTTVEPFNGAATGSGGEIRDRMAGGKGSFPLTGSAVYMTSYTRLRENRVWEQHTEPRNWLYHDPVEILIKASNGASDFGNKFGQPLTCGSLLTFEYFDQDKSYGYDKVIMLAGGVGYANELDSHKDVPSSDDNIIVMGGDNYRIGMGGGAVSSVSTGQYSNSLELNAVQRSNPEMQKRVYNVIRALSEMGKNPIVSIHDHGAGGHLNSLSELIEQTGGIIEIDKLPVGDPTLSYKELLSNESQERMGLIMKNEDLILIEKLCQRERAPFYVVGKATDDKKLVIFDSNTNEIPFRLDLADLFGKPPQSKLEGESKELLFKNVSFSCNNIYDYVRQLLQIESVACKDWLTNKVDRSVTGRVAMQQNTGILHLPLNNLSVTALDYESRSGIANAIGHAPIAGLKYPENGVRLAVAEALTNIIWAPVKNGIRGISLSANWMWPAKNKIENARLYKAVKAISDFAIDLGINIPTGKDSLSMTQKYPDGKEVHSPGTVIISAVGEVTDIYKSITPVLKSVPESSLIYIDFSSAEDKIDFSTFATMTGGLGNDPADINDPLYFAQTFEAVQYLIDSELLLSGHDISAGGKIVSLLEMAFSSEGMCIDIDLTFLDEINSFKFLFSENPGIFIQTDKTQTVCEVLDSRKISYTIIGKVMSGQVIRIKNQKEILSFPVSEYRDIWYETSYLFDKNQTKKDLALKRFENYKHQALKFSFPPNFTGKLNSQPKRSINAAVIREKGINGDREMAFALYLAGFNVIDVHMTDLAEGRETLSNINMLVFPGGFSNSDVLGSAKGWAGAFLYNEKSRKAIEKFYSRKDTMSLGVCNGCQLMMELNLLSSGGHEGPVMEHNDSGKFESAFITVNIENSPSIMLKSLEGSRLGIWIAHGEGKFNLKNFKSSDYNIALKYSYDEYPGNPNGSEMNTAGICSNDGRHLAMMPHLERSIFRWQWPYFDDSRKNDEHTPWIEAFTNARKWLEENSDQ